MVTRKIAKTTMVPTDSMSAPFLDRSTLSTKWRKAAAKHARDYRHCDDQTWGSAK